MNMSPFAIYRPDDLPSHLLLYIFCWLFTTLFAVLRTAFYMSSHAGLARLADKYPGSTAKVEHWKNDWDLLFHALQLMTYIGNAATIMISVMALNHITPWPGLNTGLLLALNALAMMFGMNVIPRILAEKYADRLTVLALAGLSGLSYLFWPVSRLVRSIERRCSDHDEGGDGPHHSPTAEENIMHFIEDNDKYDLEEDERQFIRSVFDFTETITREIMIPRVDMESIAADTPIKNCPERIRHFHHSRFPVYDESLDNVTGIVNVRDLLQAIDEGKTDRRIAELVREVPFIPETMPINDLLKFLQKEQSHLAIVVDEYGGTAGLVTIEDIVEELVGDIMDEYENPDDDIKQVNEKEFLIDGRVAVDEVNETLYLDIPSSEEYDSLAGFVISSLRCIPPPGASVKLKNATILVQTASPKQISRLRVILSHPFIKKQGS